jgi:GT2 family glycosyltransferase
MRIVALLTSHNRRETTVACLGSYFAQDVPPGVELSAVLVDDASADGTAEAVRNRFDAVNVIDGTGDLYWAGGMAVAERAASESEPDAVLWLNDDVVLDPGAVRTMIATAAEHAWGCIVAGAVRDPASHEVSYSGMRRRSGHPLKVELVTPADRSKSIDTFNGNLVLIPATAHDAVGPIDGGFVHDAADLDYGLRAAEAGIARILAPGTLGVCAANRRTIPWADPDASRSDRLRALFSPKGMPPRERARFLRRHGGSKWPLLWLASYVRALTEVLIPSRARPRA